MLARASGAPDAGSTAPPVLAGVSLPPMSGTVPGPVPGARHLVPVAVEGARNVINACADTGVRRVVFTSSYGAVHMDPNRSNDTVLDESCWSNLDYCKTKVYMVICL
ncbi:hypothetical protein E2562_000166 [Oryza meyeriana var. granulata]|uniref:3-beta hydroxysteroid dehydrogenase/isomerase domain-containing protein n=1 Tax=Oryza meyeriana var. granulata TaxID=110450 RepID=A0A6G1DDQ7_9ORYZ|nr:hypothetical protein E2562_000166 [Oryza meyeriana var. granulata]